MDSSLVGSGYADHLTDADLALLVAVTQGLTGPTRAAAGAARLRGRPEDVPLLIGDPRVFQAVFGPAAGTAVRGNAAPALGPAAPASLASPFLIFAVAVHRAAAELPSMSHVTERSGDRQRVPLFDTPQLRDFLASAARRLFLAELLGSFTRSSVAPQQTAGGPPGTRPGRGPRRPRRVSELDLPRMAGLLGEVPEAQRPGAYRRLGDVALFLAGVFPDYAAAHAFGPVNVARLLRAGQVPAREHDTLAEAPAIELLEYLGAQWYRAAWNLAPARTARLAIVADVADRFRQARRVLNHIADRYLFPLGDPWFAPPAP
ncbi:MAG TPA: hypothetical protein VHY31_17960 [Streptosporangiaceae bacterium]|nr:hypothetical protein [Streptosporangiaceae bacterium]